MNHELHIMELLLIILLFMTHHSSVIQCKCSTMYKVLNLPLTFLLTCLLCVAIPAAQAQSDSDSSNLRDNAEQCRDIDIDPAVAPLLSDDPYIVLGLPRDATDAIIIKKYRTLARKWHPDKKRHQSADVSSSTCDVASTSATKLFAAIGHAYGILSDPEKRDVYDRLGLMGLRRLQDGDDKLFPSSPT